MPITLLCTALIPITTFADGERWRPQYISIGGIALARPGISTDEWKLSALSSPALAPISRDGFVHHWEGAT